MKEILYHGSNRIVDKPEYGLGKPYNDYGRGFYCTKEFNLAGEWAVASDRDGYINEYLLTTDKLRILNLNDSGYCILDWLVILLENRRFDIQSDFGHEAVRFLKDNFSVPYNDYDVIKGYRADDSYFSFAQDFLNNTISLATLDKSLRLGHLGEQTVIKSKRAFNSIDFVKYHKAESKKYYPSKENRDTKAREEYRMLRGEPWKKGEIYLMQIIDRELTRDELFV